MNLTNEFKAIQADREKLRNDILGFNENTIYLPVNIHRLITKAKQKFDIKPTNRSDMHPHQVIQSLTKL